MKDLNLSKMLLSMSRKVSSIWLSTNSTGNNPQWRKQFSIRENGVDSQHLRNKFKQSNRLKLKSDSVSNAASFFQRSARLYICFTCLIIPASIGCIFDVAFGGININSACSKFVSLGCAGQLSTIMAIFLFCCFINMLSFKIHSSKILHVIQLFLLAL